MNRLNIVFISLLVAILLCGISCTKEDVTEQNSVLNPPKASFIAVFVNDDNTISDDYLSTDVLDGEMNEIEDKRYVAFINTSLESEYAVWHIVHEDSSLYIKLGDTLLYNFDTPGIYDVVLRASNAKGYQTISYLNFIQALPHPSPILLDSLVVVDEGEEYIDKIKMVFSRGMEPPTGKILNALDLNVYNNRIAIDVAITAIEQDISNPSILWLHLNNELYNTDSVFLSFNNQEEDVLKSTDGRFLSSFSSRVVQFQYINYFDMIETDFDWNFEGAALGDFWTNANWESTYNGGSWNIAEGFSNPNTNGENSLYFELEGGDGGAIVLSNSINYEGDNPNHVTFTLDEGMYQFVLWIYVDYLGSPNNNINSNDIRIYLNEEGFSDPTSELEFHKFTRDFPVGMWVREIADNIYTSNGEDKYIFLRIINHGNTEPIRLYIDRLEAWIMEDRFATETCKCSR